MVILDVLNQNLNIKWILIVLFIFLIINCSDAIEEYSKVDLTHTIAYRDRAENIIGKEALIIINNTKIYEDIEDFRIIGDLKFGEKVKIVKIDFDNIFKTKNEYIFFYNILTEENVNGWLKSNAIVCPYIINNEKIYGINEHIGYFKINSELIRYLRFLYIDGSNISYKDLFTLQKTGNVIYSHYFDVNSINIQDINKDNIDEIIIDGLYFDGIWKTDAAGITESELWFNIIDSNIYEIFLKNKYGNFGVYEKWGYENKLIDSDNDSFYDEIRVTYKLMMMQGFNKEGEPTYNLKETIKYYYIWNGKKYILKNYYIPTIDNLRLRNKPLLNSDIIKLLNQREKLKLLRKGKTETIDGVEGTWVQVRTEQGEIGWCFDAYLEQAE